jgi:DNA-binding beta-propeller fold protein YncE
VDGEGDAVRLQHVLDVSYSDGALFVADAYNNKIKRVDLGTGRGATLLGDGTPQLLHEPGGVAVCEGKLYVADTNNHRIRVADSASGELRTLELRFPRAA